MTKGKVDPKLDLNMRIKQRSGGIADAQYMLFKGMTGYFLDALGPAQGAAEHALKHNLLARSRAAANSMQAFGTTVSAMDDFWNLPQSTQPESTRNGPVYPNVAILKDRLVTHNEDGSLNRIFSDHVRDKFKPGDHKNWPQLILTTNHALTTDHTHISGIMEGFHSLAHHTFGKPISLIRYPDKPERDPKYKPAGTQGQSRHTLIISAVDAEPNAWLNGAKLLNRLANLREEYDENLRSGNGHKALQTEQEISPAARRLAKFIMRLMVEDQDLDRINPFGEKQIGAQEIEDAKRRKAAANDPFSTPDISAAPIILRADAKTIAQHIKLAGYSKGGNTVSDAMRYLLKELRQDIPGHAGSALIHIRDENDPTKTLPMDQRHICDIMRNIGLLCVATGEVPLTHEEKEFGIRRLSIINENDLIANHFRAGDEHRYGTHDDFLVIKGSKEHLGHGPRETLGNGVEGAILQDPSARNRLRCFFASTFDKLAISDLVIIPAHKEAGRSGKKVEAEIEIELAPGAAIQDKEIRKHVDKLVDEITKALKDVDCKLMLYTNLKTRSIRIGHADGAPFPNEALKKVVDALYTMFDELKKQDGNNIVISNNTFGAVNEYRAQDQNKPDTYARIVQERRAHVGRVTSTDLAGAERIPIAAAAR